MKSKKEISSKASLSYSNQNLNNLSSIPNNVPVEKIDVSYNPIIDFRGMKVFPELHVIDFSNTRFTSFNYFPSQEGVKCFICKKTPICSNQFLYLMCAITFGQSLESVNGVSINQNTKSTALLMTDRIRPFLIKGWIIQNLNPVKIINTQTRQRKTFYIKIDQNDNSDIDATSNENKLNNNNTNEGDQDIYLEYDSESDVEVASTAQTNSTDVTNNENQTETEDNKDNETDEEIDERLRERFNRLQESILLEMKRPDIIPTIIKGGRVTVLSNYPSRATSSLSTRQSQNSHPRAQTSLKNYPKITRENDKKT